MKTFCGLALLAFSLGGCAGYHIGPIKPYSLRAVHSIAVPTFKNNTLIPNISVLITDTVISQFQQDGTYRIASKDDADAILKGEIERVTRAPARSVRGNVLATAEFSLVLRLRYTLVDHSGKVLEAPTQVYGTTTFFVGQDVTTDERQALPLAAQELAVRLVSQVSEGW
ncbi:MAG TPA: LptE family protein [Chthoniobacterales bacterium]|nr:LptE family protein [Chthoniobacterales bacterium]